MSSFDQALRAYVSDRTGDDVVSILDCKEETESSGYCETCYYEETVLRIAYISRDPGGTSVQKSFTYYGSFLDIVRRLTQ